MYGIIVLLMFDLPKTNRIQACALILGLTVCCLGGCMDAGAADWVGARKEEAPAAEEPSEEEPESETVGEVEGGDKEVENALPSYDLPEDEPEEPEEEEEEEEDEEEEEEVSEDSVDEDYEEPEEGDNHDVTKGTWDGDEWTAEATIGDNYSVNVTVTSNRDAMKQEHVTDHAPAAEKKGDSIDDVRFTYFKRYEEGDKDAAADDVDEYEDVDKMKGSQMDALMRLSDDLGKLIVQFGITGYDFNHPAENDETEVVLDLYRGNRFQYLMTVTFDDDDLSKITDIDFELQE